MSAAMRSARMRPEIRPRAAASSRSSAFICPGSALSVTKPEPNVMTSVRPLASLCRIAASTRSTRASPTNGAPPVALDVGRGVDGALVLDIRREARGERADRQVVRIGARSPAGLVPRALAAQPRDLAVQAQRVELEGLGARHQLDRRVELQIDVGGVVDEQVADRSFPHAIGEAALAGQVQAGLAGERVGLDACDRRSCHRAWR